MICRKEFETGWSCKQVILTQALLGNSRMVLLHQTADSSLYLGTLEWKVTQVDTGGVDKIYLVFDYICLSDFLFAHIVTPPPLPPT